MRYSFSWLALAGACLAPFIDQTAWGYGLMAASFAHNALDIYANVLERRREREAERAAVARVFSRAAMRRMREEAYVSPMLRRIAGRAQA